MKIIKYKRIKDNKYQLLLDNNKTLDLYEEVILKTNLLLTKEINSKLLNQIELENKYWTNYYTALKYIRVRTRSVKETKDKLIKNNCSVENADLIINKLVEQGYLNDEFYANSFLNEQLITTSRGPKKIADELRKKGINNEIILKSLENYDEEKQFEKVDKIITRMIKSNRNKSNTLLKRKIYTDLLTSGFDKEIIDQVMENKIFTEDSSIKDKEYEKIKRRLSSKYDGKELEYKIKEQMMRKGFYV